VVALVRDDWPGALAEHVAPDVPGARLPRLVALLPLGTKAEVVAAAGALAARLARHGPVGLSGACAQPAGLGRAVESAALALDLGPMGAGGPPWRVCPDDPPRVREHYDRTIAPLVRYDDLYGTELVATLDELLDAGGDAERVAAAHGIPAHRISYRVDKVRELTGWDAARPEHQTALALGLRCRRVLAAELPR
jgi:purine catabolism regulator